MNTVEFAKRIKVQEKLIDEEKEKIMKQSVNRYGTITKYIVAIEALSELQKEITKNSTYIVNMRKDVRQSINTLRMNLKRGRNDD